jgi:mono/diheme cytochrome c family protein
MFKRILIGLVSLSIIAAGGFATFAYLSAHPSAAAIAQTQSLNELDAKLGAIQLDARLYLTACASCHYVDARTPNDDRPDLANNDTILDDDPAKLVGIIIRGRGDEMPAFGRGLSDGDIAKIAAYLRATRTKNAPWVDLESKVAAVRAKNNTRSGVTAP